MDLIGPDRYYLQFDPHAVQVASGAGERRFVGRAAARIPKLYVVSSRWRPIYVGITRQPMRSRLRLGWTADGSSGYYGYEWRHALHAAALDIWYHPEPARRTALHELETIEAEIVFLIRSRFRQWPCYQTEIHFHASKPSHRRAAVRVLNHLAKR